MQANNIKKAIKIIKKGGIVAFPTETVFGIGAALNQPKAIQKIFKIKNRPRNKPLQILVSNLEQAKKLGKFNKKALELAEKMWPGPLTLVVYKKRSVPILVTGGSSKAGLRVPQHKTILKLIKECGPIVATSANLAGEKPAQNVRDIKKSLPEIDFILPGRVKSGHASKVIDATKKPKILRP